MRALRPLIGALVILASLTAPVAAAPGASGEHARLYYLSLGDSLAAGVQPIGDPANRFRTDCGYADQLHRAIRDDLPALEHVKLGCPGESTTTMIHGGICSYPHGSQLDEAVSFLHAHREFVAFVTIDLGANDFACNDLPCFPAGVASIQQNLPAILAALREAAGPDVPIVGMTLYDPLLAAWFLGPDGEAFARLSVDAGFIPLNGLLTGIFQAGGADLADVATAFSTTDFDTLVPLPDVGTVPLNVVRICQWTWACAPAPIGPDNHANAAGYAVIAATFAATLGY
jgi:lysophospholipase L1-like esterase